MILHNLIFLVKQEKIFDLGSVLKITNLQEIAKAKQKIIASNLSLQENKNKAKIFLNTFLFKKT